jgi:AcrR family transcriptional regulator
MGDETKRRAARMEPEQRRQQFLDVAIRLFCEHGVDSTTMQQIAQGSGVSYGLFYHYFRSRDELLEAAIGRMSVLPQVQEYLGELDRPAREHLRGLPGFYLGLLEERRDIVWLVFSESRKRPWLAEKFGALAVLFRKALYDYLAARQACGEIRVGTDLDVATRVIWSYLFMRHLWIEEEPPAEEHLDVILSGLLA